MIIIFSFAIIKAPSMKTRALFCWARYLSSRIYVLD